MAQAPSLMLSRVVGRLSVAFFLDLVRIGRMDRDFLDALIVVAIIQANIAQVAGDAGLQRTYADYDNAPPDDLRRPVSVSAISHSLRLPYETVRRRVVRMARQDGYELTPQGVYIAGEALNSPEHRRMVMATCELIGDFYVRLRRLGFLAEVAAAAVPETPGAPMPARAIVRVSSDYVLRLVDLLVERLGDVVRGLIFLGILRANTEPLSDDQRGTEEGGPGSFVPDALRRPVSVAALASHFEIPHETVRRHTADLVAQRYCQRVQGGVIVPAHVLARPRMVEMMGENQANVRRMYASLARLGIVAHWEARAGAA